MVDRCSPAILIKLLRNLRHPSAVCSIRKSSTIQPSYHDNEAFPLFLYPTVVFENPFFIIPLSRFKNFKSVDTIYLKFILLSFVEHIKRLAIGSAYNALPIEKLKKYKVKLPLLKEQKLIVSKLNSLSQETKKLETIYNQKLGDLDELKKSILQKAFSGEL